MKKIVNLPDRDTVVAIAPNMIMTEFREMRGSIFHLIAAKVFAPSACSTPIDVSYVVDDESLKEDDYTILHEGYLVNTRQHVEDIQEAVRQYLKPFVSE